MNPLIASEKATDGQIETCVTLITDATRKATGTALRELVENGVLDKKGIERVRARGDEIVAAITALVKRKFAEMAENIVGIVKLISGAETLELEDTDGKVTIAQAKETFPGWIDGDFEEYGCNKESAPTTKTKVLVHEMIKNGTFAQIFGGMSDDLNYADDFVFMSSDKEVLNELLPKIQEFLITRLKLSLHPDKVFIKTVASGVDFLGWVHFPDHRVLRTSTKKRMLRNINKNTKDTTLKSYVGMLSHGNAFKLSNLLDSK